jgi:hypothetical protein
MCRIVIVILNPWARIFLSECKVIQPVKIFPAFLEPDSSLPYEQQYMAMYYGDDMLESRSKHRLFSRFFLVTPSKCQNNIYN